MCAWVSLSDVLETMCVCATMIWVWLHILTWWACRGHRWNIWACNPMNKKAAFTYKHIITKKNTFYKRNNTCILRCVYGRCKRIHLPPPPSVPQGFHCKIQPLHNARSLQNSAIPPPRGIEFLSSSIHLLTLEGLLGFVNGRQIHSPIAQVCEHHRWVGRLELLFLGLGAILERLIHHVDTLLKIDRHHRRGCLEEYELSETLIPFYIPCNHLLVEHRRDKWVKSDVGLKNASYLYSDKQGERFWFVEGGMYPRVGSLMKSYLLVPSLSN